MPFLYLKYIIQCSGRIDGNRYTKLCYPDMNSLDNDSKFEFAVGGNKDRYCLSITLSFVK